MDTVAEKQNGSNGQQDWRHMVQVWIRLRGNNGGRCAVCGRQVAVLYVGLLRDGSVLSGPYCDGDACAAPGTAPFEHCLPPLWAPPKVDSDTLIMINSAANNLAAAQDTCERMATFGNEDGALGYVEVMRAAMAVVAEQLEATRQRIISNTPNATTATVEVATV